MPAAIPMKKTPLRLPGQWVELTSVEKDDEGPILVNLANATSVWSHADGQSEIWCGATNDRDCHFKVAESLIEIATLLAAAR